MQKNLDIVDEVTAEVIRKKNERRATRETRSNLKARRGIDSYHERKRLKLELEDEW